jgi:hypothetical protein
MSGWGGKRNPNGGCVAAGILAVVGALAWLIALVLFVVASR